MKKKILNAFSELFYKAHRYMERRKSKDSSVTPYRLQYTRNTSAPRIIHFNGNFVIGGTSQLIVDIIERTSGQYDHEVIVPQLPVPLPYAPVNIQRFTLFQMTALYEHLKKQQPALVHIHYWVREPHRYRDFALWYQAVFHICEELKIPVIQNINVPCEPYKSDAVVHNAFVSRYVMNEFNKGNTACSVIYPGTDLSVFDDSPASLPSTVGMVYRLDPDKLNEEVIEIFISAVKKMPALNCYIIGGGHFLQLFKKRVREEGMTGNFHFTGYVSYRSLPALYKKLGLVVAPVHDESFGQVTPFAMGMGLPVTGYDTGAIAEILGSKETLIPYGDRDALAQMIVQLISDPGKRKKLGEHNKQRASLFSVEQMIDQYLQLYNRHRRTVIN